MCRHSRKLHQSSLQLHGLELGELGHRELRWSFLELLVACDRARKRPNSCQWAIVERAEEAYKLAIVYLRHAI